MTESTPETPVETPVEGEGPAPEVDDYPDETWQIGSLVGVDPFEEDGYSSVAVIANKTVDIAALTEEIATAAVLTPSQVRVSTQRPDIMLPPSEDNPQTVWVALTDGEASAILATITNVIEAHVAPVVEPKAVVVNEEALDTETTDLLDTLRNGEVLDNEQLSAVLRGLVG